MVAPERPWDSPPVGQRRTDSLLSLQWRALQDFCELRFAFHGRAHRGGHGEVHFGEIRTGHNCSTGDRFSDKRRIWNKAKARRVLVRRLEGKETAKGGIIIPDTAKEKPQEGEVMAIGAGKMEKGRRVPLDVKVGDRILFGKYIGNDINIDDQEYLILREEEILVKLSGMAKAASGKK